MKNASNDRSPAVEHRQRDRGDRDEHGVELSLLDVLQHDALGSLLGHDALIIRQVERGGLDPAVRIACGEDHVDDTDRGQGAKRGIPMRRVDRQVILQFLQVTAETPEPIGFAVVADGHERLERRLVVEPLVLVDLVRPNGWFNRGIELHPRHVAVVILVRRESVRATLEIACQARLDRELRGLA